MRTPNVCRFDCKENELCAPCAELGPHWSDAFDYDELNAFLGEYEDLFRRGYGRLDALILAFRKLPTPPGVDVGG